ncbi:MAG: hypothetical protein V1746_08465 [bacterium]
MFQIVFKPISSAEMSMLPKLLQLEILSEFNVLTPDFLEKNPDKFGMVKHGGRALYRYRAKDYRIYFEKTEQGFLIHRVLHKNTVKDFFFRSRLSSSEDEGWKKNPEFWKLIDPPSSISSATVKK